MRGARLRAYEPTGAVVRRCVRRGLRVYLLEWLDPGPGVARWRSPSRMRRTRARCGVWRAPQCPAH